jgi:gentisate 1,2-dioxygenase
VYCVLEGEGCTEVEGTKLEWKRNDVFTVPGWQWHGHTNTTRHNAFLYSVTDEPTMRKLGLYREEGKTVDGRIQSLAA